MLSKDWQRWGLNILCLEDFLDSEMICRKLLFFLTVKFLIQRIWILKEQSIKWVPGVSRNIQSLELCVPLNLEVLTGTLRRVFGFHIIKSGYCKILRGKHRQNIIWHKSQQHLFQSIYYSNGSKSKNKQIRPNLTQNFLHSKGNHK